MNKLLTATLIAAAGSASAATISFNSTGTAAGNSAYVDISLWQFDANLGDLQGVTVTVNEFSVAGNFTAEATSGSGMLNYFGTTATLRQKPVNILGFTTKTGSNSTDDTLVINPSVGGTLDEGDSQVFSITKYVFLTNDVTTVGSASWGAYQGPGSIFFQLRNSPVASMTSETASFSTAAATAFADITVTYTYSPTPVPEPSTYGIALGGLAIAAAVIRRRKQAK